MAKTLIAVFLDEDHTHLFKKFTKQFKHLKGKFDVVFVLSTKNYKYYSLLQSSKFKVLKNTEIFERKLDQDISNRNLLREYLVESKYYDHVLFLDSDMLLPKSLLVDLLAKEKDIITAAYLNNLNFGGQLILAPPIYKLVEDEGNKYLQLLTIYALDKPMMIEIGAAALSCCLVKRDILERLTFRKSETAKNETTAFFEDVIHKLGFKAWVDTSIQCTRQPYPDGDDRNAVFIVEKKEKESNYTHGQK